MAPTRKSRSVNKRYSDYVDVSTPTKIVANKSGRQKRKLSDMLGSPWTDEEVERFYNSYRKYGKDWKKLAAMVHTRNPEMVEALYIMNRAYLSLPEGTASVVGFIAMVSDHYNAMVDVGKRPVTGLRLYLEGKRSNHLAIHLQHLSSLPKVFQLENNVNENFNEESYNRRYYEKVQWKHFSHVCTAPVESEDELSIVTGAQLHVGDYGFKKVLFLRLRFSTVVGSAAIKNPEWDGSPGLARKSGLISTLISHHFTAVLKPPPQPAEVNINSAIYPGGPPAPVQAPKLLKFVDTTEMTRGPQETPGYWVVSGARLVVDKGKISLRVKYSLLTVILPDDEVVEEPF